METGSSINPEAVKKVLIFRSGTLGDTIVSIPAINLLKNYFKKSSFFFMTAHTGEKKIWADTILKEFNWFQEFITYAASDLKNPIRILSLIRKIHALNPDIVIEMNNTKISMPAFLREKIFFLLAGVKKVIYCYRPLINFRGNLKTRDLFSLSQVNRLIQELQKHKVINDDKITFDLPIQNRHVEKVSAAIKEAGFNNTESPLVAICPWSKQQAKRWPPERYAQLGARMIKEWDVNIAIVGGKDEIVIGQDISQSWPKARWAIFAGRLSVLESAELLRRCLFYVGNDTGAMHLAAAVGTPCVAIFSARKPKGLWYPFGAGHIILEKEVSCGNCYLSECHKNKLRCLTEITVDEVFQDCRKMFERQRKTLSG